MFLSLVVVASFGVALLGLAGMAYHAIGSALDRRRYPPPGRLVPVDGHRLHIECSGEGTPTVVLDSGLPGTVLSWKFVQSEVARFARVCSYDRAGLGWSDTGPMPRTSRQIVEELRALLRHAGIAPRYVMVGHSFGSFTARLYAGLYPEEVAGIVLVDPIHPNEWLHMPAGQRRQLHGAAGLCRQAAWVARLGVARFIALLARAGPPGVARFGVRLITRGALRETEQMLAPVMKLPAELRPIVRMFWIQPKFYEAMASQIESLWESAAQVAASASYSDKPLRVLSASNTDPNRAREHEATARLSSDGRHIVVPNSGHWIHLDEPRAVIEAIREVVETVRREKGSGRLAAQV